MGSKPTRDGEMRIFFFSTLWNVDSDGNDHGVFQGNFHMFSKVTKLICRKYKDSWVMAVSIFLDFQPYLFGEIESNSTTATTAHIFPLGLFKKTTNY